MQNWASTTIYALEADRNIGRIVGEYDQPDNVGERVIIRLTENTNIVVTLDTADILAQAFRDAAAMLAGDGEADPWADGAPNGLEAFLAPIPPFPTIR